MPLTLELVQTVAIGAFNPYLITPEWLVKFGICGRDDLDIRLVTIGTGAAFRLGELDWQVDHGKLSVASPRRGTNCGAMVSRVLEQLPHTPVQAVGHNFHFSGSREEYGDRPAPSLGTRGLSDFDNADEVRWAAVLRRGNARVEVTLAHESEAIAVLMNHHRNMDPDQARQASTADEQVAPARFAAEQFRHDFEVSIEMIRSFFATEVIDG